MNIIERIENNSKQIVEALFEWAETFDMELDEEGEKTRESYDYVWDLANRLKFNKCSERDYEDILFHIYQINYSEIRIRL